MKKVLMVVLALVIAIVPLSGCKKNGEEISMLSVWVDEEGQTVSEDTNSDVSEEQGGNTSKNQGATSSSSSKNQGGNASATKPVNGKYDFGGATYTMAITDEEQYNTTSFKQMKAAFEKKYNLKIKTNKLVFDEYNKQVTQKMSTEKSYDICYIHGSMFPGCVVGGSVLYNDLTDTVNQVNSSVINVDRSKEYFSWDGKLYGVISDDSLFAVIMYYNKYLFQNAGLEDPRELYNAGNWTWEKIFEQGAQVVKGGEYYLGHQGCPTVYGESNSYLRNGKYYNNLRSANVRKTYELVKKLYTGNDAIGTISTSNQGYVEAFANGKYYVAIEEHSKYPSFAAAAAKSVNLDKNYKNVGIVPLPLPAENTSKAYQCGWYTAIASGKGSDPTVAVLWADFSKSYKSPVKGKYELSDEDQALVDKLISGNIVNDHGSATNNSDRTLDIQARILSQVKNGGDIDKLINENYKVMSDCIATTVGKENLVEVNN